MLLRVSGSSKELWLDEVLSLTIAGQAHSVWQIFWNFPSDNNHILNTIWLYMVHDYFGIASQYRGQPWIVFRLFSLLGSVVALLCMASLKRFDAVHRLVLLCIVSFSYLCVLYGSEARGYAWLIATEFYALHLVLGKRDFAHGILFFATCVVGLLAHASFIQFLSVLLLWQMIGGERSLKVVAWYAAPVAAAAAWYVVYVSRLSVGSGTFRSPVEPITNILSVGVGGPALSLALPQVSIVAFLVASGVVALLMREIGKLFREKNPFWLLYCLGIFVVPAISILIVNPRVLYERYFLTSLVFSYLCLSSLIARGYRAGGMRRLGALGALGVFMFANLTHTTTLLQVGRGEYVEALRFLANQSGGSEVLVTGDHDFRHRVLIEYYQSSLKALPPVRFMSENQVVESGAVPTWYIGHSQDVWQQPEQEIQRVGGVYQLIKTFDAPLFSGWRWFLYSRSP